MLKLFLVCLNAYLSVCIVCLCACLFFVRMSARLHACVRACVFACLSVQKFGTGALRPSMLTSWS
jgi:hypothetical protein